MGFQHRKLLSKENCQSQCSRFCLSACWEPCPDSCNPSISYDQYPPPPSPVPHSAKPNNLLIVTFACLATAFLALCFYIIYVRYFSRWSGSRRVSPPQTTETHDELLDEDHSPVLDHPIWYIRTVGLQPSVISAITICKYKRGEGLIEGTECSVCLNEFQEDETLRLLPKCNHAFHIPCIDTWLRSHTNCPMCRAPIVSNAAGAPPPQVNIDVSGVSEETPVAILEGGGESEREQEGAVRREEETGSDVASGRKIGESSDADDGFQPMRRSVSMDSLEASKISEGLANGIREDSDGNSDKQSVKERESESSSVVIVPRRVGRRNQSLLRLMGSTSFGKSLQNRPILLKRSSSCNGKFSLPRCSKSRKTDVPLRSF